MSLQTVKTQLKYGLINKKPTTTSSIKPSKNKAIPSIFNNNDDDYFDNEEGDEEEEKDIKTNKYNKESKSNRNEIKKASQLMMKVDFTSSKSTSSNKGNTSNTTDAEADIYDYDGQYDAFKEEQTNKVAGWRPII